MRTILALLLAGAAVASPQAVRADSSGARMFVSATVVANCRLTVTPLAFGSYDPLDANAERPADASALVTVSCTRGTPALVSFDLGLHPSSRGDRSMGGPAGEQLRYQIYRDPARSQVWARGADGVRIASGSVAEPPQLTVFGRIPPNQDTGPGTFTDVLTAAVDF